MPVTGQEFKSVLLGCQCEGRHRLIHAAAALSSSTCNFTKSLSRLLKASLAVSRQDAQLISGRHWLQPQVPGCHHRSQADLNWPNTWRLWHHEEGKSDQVRHYSTHLHAHRKVFKGHRESAEAVMVDFSLVLVTYAAHSVAGNDPASFTLFQFLLSSKSCVSLKVKSWNVKIKGMRKKTVQFPNLGPSTLQNVFFVTSKNEGSATLLLLLLLFQ